MACSSSPPWHNLQHTIGGPAHPFPPFRCFKNSQKISSQS
ncbi:unnamed protein product [Spirodela intermedia]|uniref:Uncharacterized protein n=1 Tax=Spirodela intermedia TaxID=51605 RepID=A0A7I8L8U4_SPIIN|nr:unnamed protein product [Spirodela intermedia]